MLHYASLVLWTLGREPGHGKEAYGAQPVMKIMPP